MATYSFNSIQNLSGLYTGTEDYQELRAYTVSIPFRTSQVSTHSVATSVTDTACQMSFNSIQNLSGLYTRLWLYKNLLLYGVSIPFRTSQVSTQRWLVTGGH